MKSNRPYIRNKVSPKAKKRKKKAGKAKPYLLFCAISAVSCALLFCAAKGAYGWLRHSDFFTLKHINVYGCSETTPRQVLSRTMIREGINTTSIDLAEESCRIKKHPWIYRALIRRKLPDTIEIYITERKAVAVAEMDEPYFVDMHGDLFARAQGRLLHQLPRIAGIDADAVFNEETGSRTLFNGSLRLISLMKEAGFQCGSQTTFSLDTVMGISVTCSRIDLSITLGHDHFEEKITLLGRILSDLDKRGIKAHKITIASSTKAYVTIHQPGASGDSRHSAS